ncbi:MAG: CDP-alcohol phosphatidyltransferase family protein [Defluviitaleaceae bacterium]|nr:CDP-alcohol phosphatidyltransferase family protein [Defluviitaleaceae bacterium]
MIKKYLPNVLSVARILMCLPLLVLVPFSLEFLVIYTIAGITDMIDGPLARRTNTTTSLGANLDGIADLLFAVVVLFRIVPVLDISLMFLIMIAVVLGMKFSAIIIGYIRHKEIILLHTYANKFAAFALFLFPLMYIMVELNLLLSVLIIIASVAFMEEMLINFFSKVPKRDVKGLLFAKRDS